MKICPLCNENMHKLGVASSSVQYYSDGQYDDLEVMETLYNFCPECGAKLPDSCTEEWFDEEESDES